MAKQTTKTKTKSLGALPNCRVVDIGVDKFGECLKQGPATCSYALPFGYCFLCGHPRVEAMIENTKKTQGLQNS